VVAGRNNEGETMRKLLPYATIAILISATSAFAASHYYVAQKAGGGDCSVVTKKPDGKAEMMIGTASYKTKSAAEAAMKAAPECKKA
jgi:hypothetical protein